ncbi:MAG: hypothetical protein HGA37_05430 [Lentimicrobium sp.]|nr:hypothetical protein [Lentimicrobium sp.]
MNHNNEMMNGNQTIDVNSLIDRMQKEDNRNKRMIRSVYYLYIFCTVFYALLFIINPDPDLTIYDRLGGLFYVLAFLTGAFFFRREYRGLKNADYTLPLKQLLEMNVVRYRFLSWKWIIILLILLLIDAGISISFLNPGRLMQFSILEKLVIIHGVYWSILVASGIVGYVLWKKRTYPIWRDSKSLLNELIG